MMVLRVPSPRIRHPLQFMTLGISEFLVITHLFIHPPSRFCQLGILPPFHSLLLLFFPQFLISVFHFFVEEAGSEDYFVFDFFMGTIEEGKGVGVVFVEGDESVSSGEVVCDGGVLRAPRFAYGGSASDDGGKCLRLGVV